MPNQELFESICVLKTRFFFFFLRERMKERKVVQFYNWHYLLQRTWEAAWEPFDVMHMYWPKSILYIFLGYFFFEEDKGEEAKWGNAS